MDARGPIHGAAPLPGENSATDTTADRSVGMPRPGPVCVIDDDPAVRDSLTMLLETFGFSVLTFGSGAEFLSEEQRHNKGFLIVDQHMPGLDGLATLAALQNTGTPAPAVLITGRIDPGIAERATKFGVIAILEKPFATAQLVELVRASLERRDD
jgi:two-component system response regulator FixJ